MKKLFLGLLVTLTLTLTACDGELFNIDNNGDDPIPEVEVLSSEQSLATLSFISAGFLGFETEETAVSNTLFLSNLEEEEEETEIEGELDEVNVYIDRLKGFIDNGVNDLGSITETESDNELYEFKLTFTVNEEVYVIYYNVDAETGEMTGIIVIDEIEYEFEVIDNIKKYEHSEQEKNQNGNANENADDEEEEDEESEANEEESENEEEVDEEENETKMVLIATNGEDTLKVVYKTETEEDETTTKFYLEQTIDGVMREIQLKISEEEDEFKVDIKDGENEFTFKREVEEEGTVYKLTYTVDGVSGTVKIIETVDENGETVYEYQIKEGNIEKNTERGKPENKGKGNNNGNNNSNTGLSL